MVHVPGWPSLTDVEHVGDPNPFPGNISDFDSCISKYQNLVDDARMQIRRNKDAEKLERKHIREAEAYKKKLRKKIAELVRKGKKVDETFQSNIESADLEIDEATSVLSLLPAHRSQWTAELASLRSQLAWCRREKRAGLDKNGEPRKCRSPNTTTGVRCAKPSHYRKDLGWGRCTEVGH